MSLSIALKAALPSAFPIRNVWPRVNEPLTVTSPSTSNFASGLVSPIPTLSFVASIENVSVSIDNPFAPPESIKFVSLVNVQLSAFTVTRSPDVSPKIVSPLTEKLLSTDKFPSTVMFPVSERSPTTASFTRGSSVPIPTLSLESIKRTSVPSSIHPPALVARFAPLARKNADAVTLSAIVTSSST